jgi:hypothetical protein
MTEQQGKPKPWLKTKVVPPVRVTEDLEERFRRRCEGFRPVAARIRELIEADVIAWEHEQSRQERIPA